MKKIKQVLLFAASIFALLCLFMPFVHIKVGPEGYAYYGPNVPDIYIYGYKIFGKTPSEWVTVWTFQSIVILFVSISTFLVSILNLNRNLEILIFTLNSVFLGLFPWYMKGLTQAIWNNSDGLTSDAVIAQCHGFYFYYGTIIIYLVFFLLSIWTKFKFPLSSSKALE